MHLRDYFEKLSRRDASASLMDLTNEHNWWLTKYSQYETECKNVLSSAYNKYMQFQVCNHIEQNHW